jgi:hypothetical protein
MSTTSFLFVVTFGTLISNINLVPCSIGSEIEANSRKIIEEIYETDWFESSVKHKKNVNLMLTILQVQPIRMKIAGIFVVNLESFVKMANTTYSLIAFLRGFKN